MKHLRALLIFLPALLLVGAASWLYGDLEAQVERWAKARYLDDCREDAAAIAQGEVAFTEVKRPKGLRMLDRLGECKFGRGQVEGQDAIWVEVAPGVIRFAPTEVKELPVRQLARWGGMALAAAMMALLYVAVLSYQRDTRLRDDFLAAASHDLMTPLVCLKFGYDRAQVERLVRLVDNINDFLRLGGRRPPPQLEVFAVGEALKAAYALFAAQYEDEASGPVDFAGDLTLQVEADRVRTEQIFWNLFGNELKYAAPYGPVKVKVFARKGMVCVEFADGGPGMGWWQRRRCFDRYYRARTVLESGKGGFGIGLCNAREHARAMHGSLEVRPNKPHGCVFTLALPAKI